MFAFGTANRLAGISRLAPVPRDSGRVNGISAGRASTTGHYYAPSICQRSSVSGAAPSRSSCTTANEPRESVIRRQSSHWRDDD